MEPVTEALRLLKRQSELEAAMRAPGGIRITEERELYQIRARLSRYPHAARAILEASRSLERPLAQMTERDVKAWLGPNCAYAATATVRSRRTRLARAGLGPHCA